MPRDTRFPDGDPIVIPPPADGERNRQLHPFPADDPFNMAIGMDAWYAPPSDPATASLQLTGYTHININNGASHPIYFPTPGVHPLHTITNARPPWDTFGQDPQSGVESYIPSENQPGNGAQLQEILQTNALPDDHGVPGGWADRHLHIMLGNDLVELYRFFRDGGDNSGQTTAVARRIVRNRLDRYSFDRGRFAFKIENPLVNRAGTRAWGGSALAGLIRKHEVETPNPHIPHALPLQLRHSEPVSQIGRATQGSPSSPLYNVEHMFPATERDMDGYPGGDGPARMGMRFALDPNICTDAWINANAPLLTSSVHGVPAGTPNPWQIALARAMRDYGMIVVDRGGANTLSGEPGISMPVQNAIVKWGWLRPHFRRVAGAGPVHNPTEAHWDSWRASGQGWGGGAPRAPYPGPLAPL